MALYRQLAEVRRLPAARVETYLQLLPEADRAVQARRLAVWLPHPAVLREALKGSPDDVERRTIQEQLSYYRSGSSAGTLK